MANNTTLNNAVNPGDVISTEDISGVKVPRSKLVLGVYGTDDGNISATQPMPCNLTQIAGTAAAALSDTLTNPTTSQIGADLLAWDGSQWVRVRTASKYQDLQGNTITAIATIWTPASGKKIRLMGGTISLSGGSSFVLFEDNSMGNIVFRTPILVEDVPYNFDLPGGRLLSAANNVLKATVGAGVGVLWGTLWGTEE